MERAGQIRIFIVGSKFKINNDKNQDQENQNEIREMIRFHSSEMSRIFENPPKVITSTIK